MDKDQRAKTTPETKQSTQAKAVHPPFTGPLASLEKWMYDLLVVKAPYTLPKGLTDWLAKYAPWIILVIGVLLVFVAAQLWNAMSLATAILSAYSAYTGASMMLVWFWPAFIALVLQIVIMFISVPMLLKYQRSGWLLVFYANLISVIYAVLNSILYTDFGSLIMTVIAAIIGFYVLFQLRHYYVKK